jgi:hypothetical protein
MPWVAARHRTTFMRQRLLGQPRAATRLRIAPKGSASSLGQRCQIFELDGKAVRAPGQASLCQAAPGTQRLGRRLGHWRSTRHPTLHGAQSDPKQARSFALRQAQLCKCGTNFCRSHPFGLAPVGPTRDSSRSVWLGNSYKFESAYTGSKYTANISCDCHLWVQPTRPLSFAPDPRGPSSAFTGKGLKLQQVTESTVGDIALPLLGISP